MNDHRIIRELVTQIRQLQTDLDAANDETDYAHADAQSANARARYDFALAKQQIEQSQEEHASRTYARYRALDDLERARRHDNNYDEDRAIRHLRNL